MLWVWMWMCRMWVCCMWYVDVWVCVSGCMFVEMVVTDSRPHPTCLSCVCVCLVFSHPSSRFFYTPHRFARPSLSYRSHERHQTHYYSKRLLEPIAAIHHKMLLQRGEGPAAGGKGLKARSRAFQQAAEREKKGCVRSWGCLGCGGVWGVECGGGWGVGLFGVLGGGRGLRGSAC